MPDDQLAKFDNTTFWDERYRTDMTLGSGGGSRGAFLAYKRQLLNELVTRLRPRSILDVGCGDIEVTRELEFDGSYTGIDVAPSVIQRNREIRPDWTFLLGDFIALANSQALQADLVLCLDVLIHQHDPNTYRAFVCELLRASRVALVVNGFDAFPRSGRLSPNVAYHEPVTRTLHACGVEKIEVIKEFRRTLIVLVDTQESTR